MAKWAPDHHDAVDDASLDEYGVWVKSAPDGTTGMIAGEFPVAAEQEPLAAFDDAVFAGPIDDSDWTPDTGGSPGTGMDQKEQEVPDMSEKDKMNAASPSDEMEFDTELVIDAEGTGNPDSDDDLGGLTDLLLNIDEEQASEDTIYLEDDDLSLDLNDQDELGLESDMVLSNDPGGYEEEISIPGMDELNLEEDVNLEGFEDALAQLDEESLDLPDPGPGDALSPSPDLEMHDIEEVGLDEFIQETSFDDPSRSSEIVVDEGEDIQLGDADDTGPDAVSEDLGLSDPFALDEEQISNDEIIIDDMSLDLDEDIPLSPPDTQAGEIDGFDDVAALTDDLMEPVSEPAPSKPMPAAPSPAPQAASADPGALKNIEEELQAIRSELTDLRSELRKLREKGISREVSESVSASLDSTEKLVESYAPPAAEEPVPTASKPAAGGGFFDDDEDETIALTGDELDNILNSAEFTEEVGESTAPDDDVEIEPAPGASAAFEADDATEASGFEDAAGDQEFPPIEEINLHELESDVVEDEPGFDDSVIDLTSGSDGVGDDSVVAAEIVEDPFGGSEQAVEQMAAMDIDNVLAGIEELKDSEEDIELYTGDELDSMELEISDEPSKPSFASSPAPAPSAPSLAKAETPDLSGGLKQEIKAVLAYMDQLLESLPEEKIEEFARSEHFDVYKKLFTELGL